jgi:hypothetical protein
MKLQTEHTEPFDITGNLTLEDKRKLTSAIANASAVWNNEGGQKFKEAEVGLEAGIEYPETADAAIQMGQQQFTFHVIANTLKYVTRAMKTISIDKGLDRVTIKQDGREKVIIKRAFLTYREFLDTHERILIENFPEDKLDVIGIFEDSRKNIKAVHLFVSDVNRDSLLYLFEYEDGVLPDGNNFSAPISNTEPTGNNWETVARKLYTEWYIWEYGA